jgi:hypothetical protein
VTDQIDALYEFDKGRAIVRAYVNVYNGKTYLHIREFVERREDRGQPDAELMPTKAGISVEVEYLEDLENCVKALRQAIGKPKARTR